MFQEDIQECKNIAVKIVNDAISKAMVDINDRLDNLEKNIIDPKSKSKKSKK